MKKKLKEEVIQWTDDVGGHCNVNADSKYHALRLLNETVELCFAAGATENDVYQTIENEVSKEISKNGEIKPSPETISDEVADVAILIEIFAHHTNTSIDDAVADKLKILYNREWKTDEYGVIWRKK